MVDLNLNFERQQLEIMIVVSFPSVSNFGVDLSFIANYPKFLFVTADTADFASPNELNVF